MSHKIEVTIDLDAETSTEPCHVVSRFVVDKFEGGDQEVFYAWPDSEFETEEEVYKHIASLVAMETRRGNDVLVRSV